MTRLNGKQDLSKTQLLERASRHRRRKHWLEQPPGTVPREFRQFGQPIFRPVRRLAEKAVPFDTIEKEMRLRRSIWQRARDFYNQRIKGRLQRRQQ